jgi:hypothetical protein
MIGGHGGGSLLATASPASIMTNGTTALFVATPPSGGDASHGCPNSPSSPAWPAIDEDEERLA